MGCSVDKDAAVKAGPVVFRSPLLDDTQRAVAADVMQRNFGVDAQFILHATKLMLRARRKADDARERVLSRHNSGGGEDEPPLSPDSIKILSFARHRDAKDGAVRMTRESKIQAGIKLLDERMANYKLSQVVMRDDGNCQFRALAHQLTGTEESHAAVRAEVVAFMQRVRAEQFDFYFEAPQAADDYFAAMAEPGTWGDELTLRAASDLFNLRVHVLTSEERNFYVKYSPSPPTNVGAWLGQTTTKPGLLDRIRTDRAEPLDVFVAYISPIHYNSIVVNGSRVASHA